MIVCEEHLVLCTCEVFYIICMEGLTPKYFAKNLTSLAELFRFFLLMILTNSHTNSLSVDRLENYCKIRKNQIIDSVTYIMILANKMPKMY